jgi:hypothetical protein
MPHHYKKLKKKLSPKEKAEKLKAFAKERSSERREEWLKALKEKRRGLGEHNEEVDKRRRKSGVAKLKTKSAKEAAKGLGSDTGKRDIIRNIQETPGKKKKAGIGAKLKQVSRDAKKKDAFSGVMSPESVELRKGNRIRKEEARQAKNEAQTKKILSRKQKKYARKGNAGGIERLEEVKGRIGN